MARDPVCLKAVDSVENIKHVLTTTNHHAFPLLNQKGQLVGLIPKNYIIIILKQQMFYSRRPLLRVDTSNNTLQSLFDSAPRLKSESNLESTKTIRRMEKQKQDKMKKKMHKIKQFQKENKHTNLNMVHKNKYVAKVE